MKPLRITIVGAGIGGLQSALALSVSSQHHTITLLESVPEFHEVGAGIRVPPNSSRLSTSWGVDFRSIKKEISQGNRFVDWKGKHLLDCPFDNVETRYGAPYYFVHRADLINALVAAVQKRTNVTLRMGCPVLEYDFDSPRVKLASGEWLPSDLIICADGIKSSVRSTINGSPIDPMDTGDVAYRILVPAAPLLADPTIAHLVTEPWAVHWMGPEGHAVGYPLRGGEMYNIIIDITHGTDVGEPVGEREWKAQANNAELVERFKDWCDPVRKLCGMTGSYLKWRLADFAQLDRWVHPSGKVALLGDACHPMMPYMAQGAAQATEDAATLAAALDSMDDNDEDGLAAALGRYQRQRLPRAAYVAKNTRVLQEWLHLYDGVERERRDKLMKRGDGMNPIFWGCEVRRDWLFAYDARNLDGKEEGEGIPELPPWPKGEASVYGKRGRMEKGEGEGKMGL